MKIVSACLAGKNCKYDGGNNENKKVLELVKQGQCILICPEQLGGLPTPRAGAGMLGGDGHDVLAKKAKVINTDRKDVTKNYIDGSKKALDIAKEHNCKEAILKQGSPACGCGLTYLWNKGNFGKGKGDGVTTALLKKQGIKVISEEEL